MSDQVSEVAAGSSPLTRGKLTSCFVMVILGRLIPAHAGKTHTRTHTRTGATAHPRSRGENVVW